MRAKEREREREREREQVQEQHTQQRAATTLAIKAAYGFYDSINLKCSMPNNKIPLFSLRPNYLAAMSRGEECAR